MRLGSRAKETKKKGTPRTQPGVREAGESGEQGERGTGPKGGRARSAAREIVYGTPRSKGIA